MALGDNCSASCLTRNHETFGQCMKSKSLRVGWAATAAGRDLSEQKRWDRDLSFYKDARRQGVQPASTQRESVERAMTISEKTGTAYQA